MSSSRILVLHDDPILSNALARLCRRHGASLIRVESPAELLEHIGDVGSEAADLVIAKDTGAARLSVCGVLIGARASGVETPFLVDGDPGDLWTRKLVDTAGSAALLDTRDGPLLMLVLVQDWLERRNARRNASAIPLSRAGAPRDGMAERSRIH